MAAAEPLRPPAATAVVAIAHRAGNDRRAILAAIEARADWIEADIWWQNGQLVARHEHALWRLPIRYDEWKIGMALRPALRLSEICALLAEGPQLLIDLKGNAPRLPFAIVDSLRQAGATERSAVCGQCWPALDAAVREEPALRAFYSLATERQFHGLRDRPRALPPITAVSCAEGLLTPTVVAELIERGMTIFAWTVNARERALELLAAGVQGITTDSAEVLAAVRDYRQLPES